MAGPDWKIPLKDDLQPFPGLKKKKKKGNGGIFGRIALMPYNTLKLGMNNEHEGRLKAFKDYTIDIDSDYLQYFGGH